MICSVRTALKKVFITALTALLFLPASGCEGITGSSENKADLDPEEESVFSFWVKLKLSPEIPMRYQVVRVYLSGENAEKIGISAGPFDGSRFKITVPQKYKNTEQRFTIEFTRKTSYLDQIPEISKYPVVMGILKAFYYTTPDKDDAGDPLPLVELPDTGGEIELPDNNLGSLITVDELNMGYGEQSRDILANIPGLPPMFKVELNQAGVQQYTTAGYRAYVGLAVKPETPIDRILEASGGMHINPNDFEGFCGGDDWYLILKENTSLKKGDPVRIWIIFTHENLLPRLYYEDVENGLPDVFSVITLTPVFAGLPISNLVFAALLVPSGPWSGKNDSFVMISPCNYSSTWIPTAGIFTGFTGEFRGAGFSVTGLNFAASSDDYGFFSSVTNGIISDVSINIGSYTSGAASNLGGAAGRASGTTQIRNVHVTGALLSGASNTGGIAGYAEPSVTVEDCTQTVAAKDVGNR
jgi:hypothetical protein